eukprot:1487536-Rhodomonas_salina.1
MTQVCRHAFCEASPARKHSMLSQGMAGRAAVGAEPRQCTGRPDRLGPQRCPRLYHPGVWLGLSGQVETPGAREEALQLSWFLSSLDWVPEYQLPSLSLFAPRWSALPPHLAPLSLLFSSTPPPCVLPCCHFCAVASLRASLRHVFQPQTMCPSLRPQSRSRSCSLPPPHSPALPPPQPSVVHPPRPQTQPTVRGAEVVAGLFRRGVWLRPG